MKTGYRLVLEYAPNGCNMKVDVDADDYMIDDFADAEWFVFSKKGHEVFAIRAEFVFSVEKIGEFNEDNK